MSHPLDVDSFKIVRGENDLLFDAAGRAYIDLFAGHGAVWVGHGHPTIQAALTAQLQRIGLTGGIPHDQGDAARQAITSWLPNTYRVAAIYSTGMEVAEYAARLAIVETGRNQLLGFDGCMHGKSIVTSQLGWDNAFRPLVTSVARLAFPNETQRENSLSQLRSRLARCDVAAVFIEPWLGSAGGHHISSETLRRIAEECRRVGTWLIIDEMLTGYFRTGPSFCFAEAQIEPAGILLGKGIANGFPASALALRHPIVTGRAALPLSTFAGNPLACAAIRATSAVMQQLDMEKCVRRIESIVLEYLPSAIPRDIILRGRGAFWVLAFPSVESATAATHAIYQAGVAVGQAGAYVRLLPSVTIDANRFQQACHIVGTVLQEHTHS